MPLSRRGSGGKQYFAIKAFQHPSKIIKNDPKSFPKWSKTEVRRGSGRLLGVSWAALGRSLAPRHLWAASWPPLGQLLGGS